MMREERGFMLLNPFIGRIYLQVDNCSITYYRHVNVIKQNAELINHSVYIMCTCGMITLICEISEMHSYANRGKTTFVLE